MPESNLQTTIEIERSRDGERWFAVVSLEHSRDLGHQIRESISQLGDDPVLAMVLLASASDQLPVVDSIRKHLSGVPVIGCTTAGLVNRAGQAETPGQLIVLGGPGFRANTSISSYETDGCRSAGSAVADATSFDHQKGWTDTMFLLSDGLRGNVADVIRGAYSVGGAVVSIAGGCAGDNMAMCETLQFTAHRALPDSVAGALVSSTGPIEIGIAHGWEPLGEPMVVTGSVGTTVTGLNDRPALDVYLETVGLDRSFADSAEFSRFALTRPLALSDGVSHIRFVTGSDLESGSLEFLVNIPEGQMVTIMGGTPRSVVEAARSAVSEAVSRLGCKPIGIIAFDCIARRSVLGDQGVHDEVAALTSELPASTPVGGFYSYGEIARTGGALGLHHQTLVVVALG